MNQVILLILENSLEHSHAEQKENSTAAARVVSMEFYKKQVFRSVHYLQAASKGDGWRSSAVSTAVNGCLRYAEAALHKYQQTHQLLL